MPENWQTDGFGLYIHWPFCASKCPYCDFNSHVARDIDQRLWNRAYSSEIARLGRETKGRLLGSVFLGGGTPSLMQPDLVASILDMVQSTWTTANDIEITLEANPTSVETGRFAALRAAGVNRVSIGVQALNDPDLRALGRRHSVSEALQAIETARNIFDRVSFDLIYARQHQSLRDWQTELRQAMTLAPDHLSLYQLTVEPGTAFGHRLSGNRLPGLPDEDLGADLYEATQEICGTAGLPAYEVSNHAKPGAESCHNLTYWRSGDWGGIGPGAHGRLSFSGQRLATDTLLAPSEWLAQVAKTGSGENTRQALATKDLDFETLMMGLRLREGIALDRLLRPDPLREKLAYLRDIGMVRLENSRIAVTNSGRPVLNSILRELMLSRD